MTDRQAQALDIVVAGGGMIGSCLALALQPLGLKVAVVEPVAADVDAQPSFDDRTTALSRSTQRMFDAMGIWEAVRQAATPIRHIHVSDRGRFGFSHIDAEEQDVEALGYVIINRVLGTVLRERLRGAAGLQWICPASINGVAGRDDCRQLAVRCNDASGDTERELTCRLLIAADGATSTVRDMLGIGARRVDYGQTAIVGNVRPDKAMNNVAFERFTDDGPLALLPMPDNRAAFVWTLATQDAARAMALPDEAFIRELQNRFGYRLGALSTIGRRTAYPLTLSKANSLTVQRAVLVGNAAHGLHPVAAQGYNLGMRDVAALCDCLFDAQQRTHHDRRAFDAGSDDILESYATWRRSDQEKLVGFTDGLVRLFGASTMPARVLRDAGMLAFDLLPGVRRAFARHTMGLAGRLPRLSRGVPLE